MAEPTKTSPANEIATAEAPGNFVPIGEDHDGVNSYQEILAELRKMFDFLNKECFSSEIRPPIISVVGSKKGPKTDCWCASEPVWKKTDGVLKYNEICFLAAGLDRPLRDICNDLAHQMVHIYNAQKGVKDSCRGGTYHNNLFKNTATELGFICSAENKSKGYCDIKLTDAVFGGLLDIVNQDAFSLIRVEPPPPPKEPKEKKPPTAAEDFSERLKELIRDLYGNGESTPKIGDVAIAAKELAETIMYEEPAERCGMTFSHVPTENINVSAKKPPVSYSADYDNDIDEEDFADDEDYGEELPIAPVTHPAAKLSQPHLGPYNYSCPGCGAQMQAHSKINVLCIDCNIPFVID